MGVLLNIINFALVIGIVVFVHELGHLLAAKAFGVYCHEFAIGMGPKLFSIKRPNWETTYSIRLLPFGGFVSMAGEPGEKEYDVEIERTINGISRWKRLIIMLAGVTMNFLLGFIIFTGVFFNTGEIITPDATINTVEPGYPAEKAGLQPGDKIVKIEFFDGDIININSFDDVSTYLTTYGEHEMEITYERDGKEYTTKLTPVKSGSAWVIGITSLPSTVKSINLFEAMGVSVRYMSTVISSLFFVLSKLFKGIGTDAIGGPIGIYQATSSIKDYGFMYFIQLVGLFSINLAVINLLPVPVLDGGRALITLIEMIIRRPLPQKVENIVMFIGTILIFAFMIFAISNDIFKLMK